MSNGPSSYEELANSLLQSNSTYRDYSSIWDNARELSAKAGELVKSGSMPAYSELWDAFTKNNQALVLYRNLLDMTSSNSTLNATVLKETKNAIDNSHDLIKKMLFDRQVKDQEGITDSTTIAELSKVLYGSEKGTSTQESKAAKEAADAICVNIPLETEEDIGIVRKICSSVVRKVCGFRSFNDYAGGKELQKFFQGIAVDRFKYKRFDEEHPNIESILLFGPPGTGKTLLAEAVANELQPYGAKFISISASDIKGRYVGESEKGIKYLFTVARELTKGPSGKRGEVPVVVFMDEIEGLVEEGGGSGGSASTGVLAEFNAQVSGAKGESNKGIIVIGATNYPERIPSAAFQRFFYRLFIGLPSLDNVREILIKRLRRMGWERLNFSSNPNLPMWLKEIDWNREQFITNYLNIGPGNPNFKEWSVPVTFEVPPAEGWAKMAETNYVSNFFKIATPDDFNAPSSIITPSGVGEPYFDVTGRGRLTNDGSKELDFQNPWDLVDFMAFLLFSEYYAPREIDSIFSMMLLLAEQRSVAFVTGNPLNNSKVFFQKWLLQKNVVTKDVEIDGKCVKNKRLPPRYAFIPLSFTIGDMGEQSEQYNKVFKDRLENNGIYDFGSIYGYQKSISINQISMGQAKTLCKRITVPKYNYWNKDNEIKVVVSRTEIIDSTLVRDVLRKGEPTKQDVRYHVEQQMKTKNIAVTIPPAPTKNYATLQDLNKTYESTAISYYPYIPMEKWDPPSEEKLSPQNMPRVLGISQVTLDDFFEAKNSIRSITIRNVKQMIDYAENFGRSVKNGEDIQQLKQQARLMENTPKVDVPDASRYLEIWKQFADSLVSLSSPTPV